MGLSTGQQSRRADRRQQHPPPRNSRDAKPKKKLNSKQRIRPMALGFGVASGGDGGGRRRRGREKKSLGQGRFSLDAAWMRPSLAVGDPAREAPRRAVLAVLAPGRSFLGFPGSKHRAICFHPDARNSPCFFFSAFSRCNMIIWSQKTPNCRSSLTLSVISSLPTPVPAARRWRRHLEPVGPQWGRPQPVSRSQPDPP